MILTPHPSLTVQQDDLLSLLRIGWTGGMNKTTVREATMCFVDLADQFGSQRLLIDLTIPFDLPVYDQLWLSATLLPRALSLKVQQLVVALPERQLYNRQVLEFILRQYQTMRRAMNRPPGDFQFFEQADAACEWLTDYSCRVPGLLTEWHQSLRQPSMLVTLPA